MPRASGASTRLLLLQLSRRLPSLSQPEALSWSPRISYVSVSTDESKSDGRDGDSRGRSRSPPSAASARPRPPQQPHWLDRRAPAAAEWLDAQARELWLRGLEERCKAIPELSGHELLLRRLVSERAEALMRRHSRRFLEEEKEEEEQTNHSSNDDDDDDTNGDDKRRRTTKTTSRARTHLQTAALVRATGDALLPFFRGDEQMVLEALRDSTGGRVSGLLKAMLRLQARLASLLPFSSLSSSSEGGVAERRLRLLRNDYGGAWPGAEIVVVEENGRDEGEEEEEEDESGDGGREARTNGSGGGFFSSSLRPSSFLRSGSPSASAFVRLKTTTTTLRVPRCLYYDMMTSSNGDGGEEGNDGDDRRDACSPRPLRPRRWLEACCCSVDGVWFEPWISGNSDPDDDGSLSGLRAARKGGIEPLVSFRRRRWLGESGGGGGGGKNGGEGAAAACELCVTRVEAVRSKIQ